MLIDLLSPANYVSYNIKIAEVLGLKAAVYISEIANINSKAIRKDKVENNFFTLDRAYLTKRTTLSESEQLEIEGKLISISVLEKNDANSDMLYLNIDNLVSIMINGTPNIIKDVQKLVKKPVKKPGTNNKFKRQKDLQKAVRNTLPQLRTAYYGWIDANMNKWFTGFQPVHVEAAERMIDQYAQGKISVALELLDIATIGTMRDMQYAIARYEERHPKETKVRHDMQGEDWHTVQIGEAF